MGADDVTTIVDERYEPRQGEIIKVKILDVPASDKHPEGIKYVFHYGRTDDETTYLRYDNAHGIHERHDGENTEELDEFPGLGPLLRQFRNKVSR